ncbi:MAG: protein kinase domain-containing protein [Hyphomicrobiales bacterium]|nr:protein kinase domain-containing protein [Hyphomicrobiales bacterium]
MDTKINLQVQGRSGAIPLGAIIGRGGEGAVYEVANSPDRVVKLYHKPMAAEKAAKVEAMTSMRTEKLAALTAWPAELLRSPSGEPRGLLMPRVVGHKDIHNLYSPRSRKQEFPTADWRFLLRVALNTARAFGTIHEAGCVIGDVNHGGVVVSDKATVKLIDCDSFQVVTPNGKFLCEVGTPTFTPPELQGKSFRGLLRNPNHDNFGLAVLLFHLLFMGRHPFAGRFLGRGDMSIEKAIEELRFPYGTQKAAAQMEPPPNVPALAVASEPIAKLLERAFSREGVSGSRPTASEWAIALDALEKQLKQCRINTSHYHFGALQSCPWCALEAATGVLLFNVRVAVEGTNATAFELDRVWKLIEGVQPPGPAPQLLTRRQLGNVQPSSEAVNARANGTLRGLGVFVVILAVLGLCGAVPSVWWLWMIGGYFLGRHILTQDTASPAVNTFVVKHSGAQASYNSLQQRWQREADDAKFQEKLRELQTLRNKWQKVPSLRQRRYRELEQAREQQQRRKYLERFSIDKAKIPGIGPGRKVMLESYNVETAWDITDHNVARVPGFGPALTEKLKEWRQGVERGFRFDPSQGVDPQAIAALDREMRKARLDIEQLLTRGPAELAQIKAQIVTQRKSLETQVNAALKALMQAEIDLKTAKGY